MSGLPNIILLTIDALRADHCSNLGYERETTPGLDAFADKAVEFRECVSVSSHTREAMPPLLSGYRPAWFAANGFRPPEEHLLAERLSASGYATGGFHSNPYLSRAYGFDRGFDEFYDDLILGETRFLALAQRALEKFVFKRGEYYARADEINRRSLEWLDSISTNQPVFLWNHYMDAHGPYHSPEKYWAKESLSASDAESLYRRSWKDPDSITGTERDLLIDSYDDEIRWLDSHLVTFLDELRKRNLLEESLVVITADHGDAFGEHGYFTHPRHLHDTLLRVPLIISLPEVNCATLDQQVSTLDIVPTITSSAGIDAKLPGTPLVNDTGEVSSGHDTVFASATGENDEDGVRRFSGRQTTAKVVIKVDRSDGSTVSSRAYNLAADPREREPVAESQYSELLTATEAYANGRLDVRKGPKDAAAEGDIEERLEALGYK